MAPLQSEEIGWNASMENDIGVTIRDHSPPLRRKKASSSPQPVQNRKRQRCGEDDDWFWHSALVEGCVSPRPDTPSSVHENGFCPPMSSDTEEYAYQLPRPNIECEEEDSSTPLSSPGANSIHSVEHGEPEDESAYQPPTDRDAPRRKNTMAAWLKENHILPGNVDPVRDSAQAIQSEDCDQIRERLDKFRNWHPSVQGWFLTMLDITSYQYYYFRSYPGPSERKFCAAYRRAKIFFASEDYADLRERQVVTASLRKPVLIRVETPSLMHTPIEPTIDLDAMEGIRLRRTFAVSIAYGQASGERIPPNEIGLRLLRRLGGKVTRYQYFMVTNAFRRQRREDWSLLSVCHSREEIEKWTADEVRDGVRKLLDSNRWKGGMEIHWNLTFGVDVWHDTVEKFLRGKGSSAFNARIAGILKAHFAGHIRIKELEPRIEWEWVGF